MPYWFPMTFVANGERGCFVQVVYQLAPLIADIVSAYRPGTRAREEFMRACVRGHWEEAKAMIEGMLAEPDYLRGCQESRLREFLELVQMRQGMRKPLGANGHAGR